ncbi:small integral membrane protein 28-like [Myxocyprinus asiaticus]|uniref:small integral membrane protein 28-like n=1 Tax=Myxocyprinus asiaticus TaxID=70543 RepID=UPI00222298F0|nr:small integral membrane protein 28-like [Myxocyprinus asiaticus]
MRVLLDTVESSWIQFGPAGRDSYDWVAGTSAPPLTDNHLQGDWSELTSNKVKERMEITLYVVILAGSLLFLTVMAFLVYKGCSKIKKNTSSVIQLDFQDADSSAEFLSSLEEQEASEEGSDGLLLMVYLPAPYEKTLTRIARAASISSTRNDAEIVELDENSADQK